MFFQVPHLPADNIQQPDEHKARGLPAYHLPALYGNPAGNVRVPGHTLV